MKMIFCNRFSV